MMQQRILILGAYGFIGAAAARRLAARGHQVTGLGRDAAWGAQLIPQIGWEAADLRDLDPARAATFLDETDVVVNAAGALQDGPRDDLMAVHAGMVALLAPLCAARGIRWVQISAVGVRPGTGIAFLDTKAEGDALLRQSGADHLILRPGLVLGPQAYGGTAMLRALAALPLIAPRMPWENPVQTIGIDALSAAITRAAEGELPQGFEGDVAAAEKIPFTVLLRRLRSWLGFRGFRVAVPLPAGLLALAGRAADLAAWLGWRPPLRSTALRIMRGGVTADLSAWEAAGQPPIPSLDESLAAMPATIQERWFARLYLFMPLMVLTLALFWTGTGLITLADIRAAASVLTDRALPPGWAMAIATGGAALDIVLGLAVLMRRWARPAALGMILVSGVYLAGATWLAPDLWADPLGPLLKVLPGMMLAAALWTVLEER